MKKVRTYGFTLLEVLIALFVLSIGLLGLAALQTTSMSLNTDSLYRTQYTFLVSDIVDRMRANMKGVTNGDYTVATVSAAATKKASTAPSCESAVCTYQNIALYDLVQWYDRIGRALPGANDATKLATINIAGNSATIRLQWMERDLPRDQTWVVRLWP